MNQGRRLRHSGRSVRGSSPEILALSPKNVQCTQVIFEFEPIY